LFHSITLIVKLLHFLRNSGTSFYFLTVDEDWKNNVRITVSSPREGLNFIDRIAQILLSSINVFGGLGASVSKCACSGYRPKGYCWINWG
jgi:hypothetical protein